VHQEDPLEEALTFHPYNTPTGRHILRTETRKRTWRLLELQDITYLDLFQKIQIHPVAHGRLVRYPPGNIEDHITVALLGWEVPVGPKMYNYNLYMTYRFFPARADWVFCRDDLEEEMFPETPLTPMHDEMVNSL
jgi:hypothetical protein